MYLNLPFKLSILNFPNILQKFWFLRTEIAVYHIDLGYCKINGKMWLQTYVIQSLPSIPSLKIFQILQQQYNIHPYQMSILSLDGKLCTIFWQPKFTIQSKLLFLFRSVPFKMSHLLCLCQYLMVKYASGIWQTYFTIQTLPCWIWMVNYVLYFVSHSFPIWPQT